MNVLFWITHSEVATWTHLRSTRLWQILTGLEMPAPTDIIQTMLMKDGYFVGYKFRYDGGHAILQASGNVIEFYDERGKLLKPAAVEGDQGAAA
jgi:hypothetical protein